MSKKYNKVNKKLLSTVLITVLSTGLVVGVVGGVTNGFEDWNLKNWKNNLISEDKIDNTRVALTMPGTYKEQDTYLYVYMDHPKLEDTYELYEWPGISLRNKYKTEGFEYISFDDNNLYTIELTSLLPLDYENYEEFQVSGGTIGAVVSYVNEDGERIQSDNIVLNESGKHTVKMPRRNHDKVSHSVTKYIIEEVEEEKNNNTSSTGTKEETNSSSTEE